MSDIMKQARAAQARYKTLITELKALQSMGIEYPHSEVTELLQGTKEAKDTISALLEKQIEAQAITVEREG